MKYRFIKLMLLCCSTAFLITSCGINKTIETEANQVQPTVYRSETPWLKKTHTTTPTLRKTRTPFPKRPTKTSTISPSPTVTVAPVIKKITRIAPDPSDDRFVSTAFWPKDGRKIQYLLTDDSQNRFDWYEYDFQSGSSVAIAPLIPYDPQVWKVLNVTDPKKEGYDPILMGYVSPSGNYLIYPQYLRQSANSGEAQTNIWIASKDGKIRHKIIHTSIYSGITQAVWVANEQQVIFDVTTHGGDIYIADTKTGALVNFSQLTENKASATNDWRVSPEGDLIAASYGDITYIFSLDGKVAYEFYEYAENISWTPNGENICYLTYVAPLQKDNFLPLRAKQSYHCYNLKSDKIISLLDVQGLKGLEKRGFSINGSVQVSNDLKKILSSYFVLWLIELY